MVRDHRISNKDLNCLVIILKKYLSLKLLISAVIFNH